MLKLRNWIFYYFYVPHTMFLLRKELWKGKEERWETKKNKQVIYYVIIIL